MIKEAYCSFEVSKLLKEKGFSENTEHKIWYVVKQFSTGCPWNSCTYKVGDTTREYNSYCCISMPTHQMAMAWLREVHGIYIVFFHTNKSGWWYNITDMRDSYVFYSSEKTKCSYEEIVEAALKYILENLI